MAICENEMVQEHMQRSHPLRRSKGSPDDKGAAIQSPDSGIKSGYQNRGRQQGRDLSADSLNNMTLNNYRDNLNNRSYRSQSSGSCNIPPTQKEKLWKEFHNKIKGSLLGIKNPIDQIRAKEELLDSQGRHYSPEEKKYLRQEIQKERQSVERALQLSDPRSSPLKLSTSLSGFVFSNERSQGLQKQYQDIPGSPNNLMTFNEHTLGRPSHLGASPLRDLFQLDHSSQKFNQLQQYLQRQQT